MDKKKEEEKAPVENIEKPKTETPSTPVVEPMPVMPEMPAPVAPVAPTPAPVANPTTTPTPVTPSQSADGLAIASLVCGVLAFFGGWITGFGSLLGIAAIITGAIAIKKKVAGKGLSIAGIVTGALALIFNLIIIVLALVAFFVTNAAKNVIDEASDSIDNTSITTTVKSSNNENEKVYKTASKGDRLTTYGGLEINVTGTMRDYKPGDSDYISSYNELVVVHVILSNPNDEDIYVSSLDFSLSSYEGNNDLTSINSLSDTALISEIIRPGETFSYDLPFEILDGDTNLKLLYTEEDLYLNGDYVDAYNYVEV